MEDDGIRVGTGAPPPPPVGIMEAMTNTSRKTITAPPPPPPLKQAAGAPLPRGVLAGFSSQTHRPSVTEESDEEEDDYDEEEEDEEEEDEEEEDEEEEEESPESAAQRAFLEEEQKAAMLGRIAKIKATHRLPGPALSRHSTVEDVRFELRRLEDELVLRQSVKVQRRVLMAVATGIEFVHHKTPVRGKLEGWSESIMASIDDYDDVFDRLHRKHAPKLGFGKGKPMEPELELAMMVGYSAFSFALSNTMVQLGRPAPPSTMPAGGGGGAASGAATAAVGDFSAERYKQRAASMGFKAEEAAMRRAPAPAASSSNRLPPPPPRGAASPPGGGGAATGVTFKKKTASS